MQSKKLIHNLQRVFSVFLFIVLSGTVLTALALQYIWGFIPCELCLLERIPYYVGSGIMLLAFIMTLFGSAPKLMTIAFIIIGLLMLYDFGLSLYHVGVELKYWQGPAVCSSTNLPPITNIKGSLLDNLNQMHIIPCDQAAGYIFGISFAGWNAITTFVFAVFAFFAACFPFLYAKRQIAR